MSDPDQPTAETPAWWSFERFMNDEARDRRCPNVIDVTGRARYLFFGPFINLPAGHWRATVFLELCPDAARRRLAVQFGSEPDYTTEGVPGGIAGPHTLRLDHSSPEPGSYQIRLWLMKAAFHGSIRFSGARVELIGDALPSPETGSDETAC